MWQKQKNLPTSSYHPQKRKTKKKTQSGRRYEVIAMQVLTDPGTILLLVMILLGFLGGFVDNAFGMGYSLLTPIFILIGFDPLIVVPTLLLSQTVAGLTGSVFHRLFKNIEFSSPNRREAKIYILFTTIGVIGAVISATLAVTLPDWFMLAYIGLMMLIVGIVVHFKISFTGGWWKMYLASGIGGFNKAISGGGYGPLVTSVQIMTGSDVKSSVGITQFSESTISSIAFLMYIALTDIYRVILVLQSAIVMVVTGAAAAPLGALFVRRLDERRARRVVGTCSVLLGLVTLLRLFLL
jgi:hypothetical protein